MQAMTFVALPHSRHVLIGCKRIHECREVQGCARMADIEYPLESLRLYACTEWGTRLQTSAIQTLADEVMSIELGDQRLTRRTGKILEQLFRQPCNRMGTCDEGKADSVDTPDESTGPNPGKSAREAGLVYKVP